jgi:cell wall-associated NlpC family hydrolase
LAAAALEGVVAAERHAPTTPWRCAAPAAALRRAPAAGAEQLNQLLFGEAFDVLETKDDWCWGQARRDGYVGYVARGDLDELGPRPTHRVSAPRAYAFSEPSVRAPARGPLSLNSLVRCGRADGRFVEAEGLGWMLAHQLAPVGIFEADHAAVAERFVGAAYLWGGREAQGLDCSGLVQQALFACGRACPRDTEHQQALGRAIDAPDLRRGDLVFWWGHVAIMIDEARVVHATAHHAAVAIEPLSEAIARIATAGDGPPAAYRRL